MRLTLRTLLAYLDDVLEPSQAKEIGQKIKDSPVATALVERIKEVMRRRRLGTPDMEGAGSGVNPNSVAEYLDNTLSPDQVAQLEKICLESDTQLAEVASVHQILTLVLGEPVSVSAETRERMYGLHPKEKALDAPVKKKGSSDHSINMMDKPPTAADRVASLAGSGVIPKGAIPPEPVAVTGDDRITELPKELLPQPFWKQSLPYVAILAVAGTWLGFLMVDKSLRKPAHHEQSVAVAAPSPETAEADEEEAPVATKTEPGAPVAPDKKPEGPDKKPEGVVVAAKEKTTSPEKPKSEKPGPEKPGAEKPAAETPASKPTEKTEPPKLGDEPEPDEKPVLAAKTAPPMPEAELNSTTPPKGDTPSAEPEKKMTPAAPEAAAKSPPPAPASPETASKEKGATPPPPAPDTELAKLTPATKPTDAVTNEAIPAAEAEYRTGDSILLRVSREKKQWVMKPRQSVVKDQEQLAVPEPFESELSLKEGGDSILILGKTRLQWVGPREGAECGLVLNRGRVIFRPKKSAGKEKGANQPVMSVSVTVGLDSWLVQIMTDETNCGVQVTPYEPSQFEEASNPDKYTATLAVAAGSVRVSRIDGSQAADRFHTVNGPASYALTPKSQNQKVSSVDELLNEVLEDKSGTAKKIQEGKVVLGYEWLQDRKTGNQRNSQWRKFEKEFEETLNEPVIPMLISYSNSKVAYESQLATSCLGLIGEYDTLVKVADRSPHEESRRTAIQELRIWLIQSPEHGRLLRDDLAKHFQPEDADVLYHLVWGFNENDARNQETSQKLVDSLSSESMAIREAAFQQIKQLTNGRHNDYRPNSSASTRQLAIEKWREHLKKYGALLPPEAPAAENAKTQK
ncbi:MAG: hypothetical protein U0903_13415 [Planctomycetales bacterium]